ncbi:ABC transporter substrate-binding protein [Ancylobacter dichloromethanicus]|uniref:ABC transporter substrate-binding protein n=1 Tax=Ancylobacter dichloromethanicus TaxID=518825 RepID=A0A9W6JA86_9HYPH|nr:ABC transporter substrate-binding protein [Ancylobacter dichloromethanicus]MBS7552775.1 ABC transporter substrate-binding protein [Ancylobacter dichloromethanicus]GLK72139.1 ABC transporter substrate-binding protein [Ancylobacter dichloromethanicus]
MIVISRRRLLGSIAVAALVPGALARAAESVVVSSKIDTEGAVLGNIVALVLEHAGIPVTRRLQLGPTKIVRTALLAGEIDLYPEYTGNAGFFFNMADDPVWKNAGEAYAKAKELDAANGLVWLAPAPADNTWGIAVRGDVAAEAELATLEDFARWANADDAVKLAASAEFVESAAALPAFQSAYGFTLSGDELLVLSGGDTAATIKAAAEGTSGVNSAMVYGTDGAISAVGLKVMEDTKHVQPVYQPAPVIRKAVLDTYPQIAGLLAPAFAGLTLETLQRLNAQVQLEGLDARSVAEGYLRAQGLLG